MRKPLQPMVLRRQETQAYRQAEFFRMQLFTPAGLAYEPLPEPPGRVLVEDRSTFVYVYLPPQTQYWDGFRQVGDVIWQGHPKSFAMFEPVGSTVHVSDIFRGTMPKGSAGRMVAD